MRMNTASNGIMARWSVEKIKNSGAKRVYVGHGEPFGLPIGLTSVMDNFFRLNLIPPPPFSTLEKGGNLILGGFEILSPKRRGDLGARSYFHP